MNSFLDFLCDGLVWLVGVLVVMFAGMLALLCGGIYFINENRCSISGDELNVETHYRFWGQGCYVQDGDRFVPLDNYRISIEAK